MPGPRAAARASRFKPSAGVTSTRTRMTLARVVGHARDVLAARRTRRSRRSRRCARRSCRGNGLRSARPYAPAQPPSCRCRSTETLCPIAPPIRAPATRATSLPRPWPIWLPTTVPSAPPRSVPPTWLYENGPSETGRVSCQHSRTGSLTRTCRRIGSTCTHVGEVGVATVVVAIVVRNVRGVGQGRAGSQREAGRRRENPIGACHGAPP